MASLNGRKVWILKDPIEGPPFWCSEFGQILSFLYICLFLKFVVSIALSFGIKPETIKKFEFWRPRMKGTPDYDTPKIYFSFIFTYSENFISLV